ncbi:MAG: hypothetical protein ACYC26_00105 [Phycisphaerales bacterium]
MDMPTHGSVWKQCIAQGVVVVFSLVFVALGTGVAISAADEMVTGWQHTPIVSADFLGRVLAMLYGMWLVIGGVSCWFMHHADAWQRMALLPWWPICLLLMRRRLPSQRKWDMQRRCDRQQRGADARR